jgi:hypothetical protein
MERAAAEASPEVTFGCYVDKAYVELLEQQIRNMQQAYQLLYSRNLELYSELNAANEKLDRIQTCCLRAGAEQSASVESE